MMKTRFRPWCSKNQSLCKQRGDQTTMQQQPAAVSGEIGGSVDCLISHSNWKGRERERGCLACPFLCWCSQYWQDMTQQFFSGGEVVTVWAKSFFSVGTSSSSSSCVFSTEEVEPSFFLWSHADFECDKNRWEIEVMMHHWCLPKCVGISQLLEQEILKSFFLGWKKMKKRDLNKSKSDYDKKEEQEQLVRNSKTLRLSG